MSTVKFGEELFTVCDFCAASLDEAKMIITGQGVHICEECVDVMAQIVATRRKDRGEPAHIHRANDRYDA